MEPIASLLQSGHIYKDITIKMIKTISMQAVTRNACILEEYII